jgi:hypothetical protein
MVEPIHKHGTFDFGATVVVLYNLRMNAYLMRLDKRITTFVRDIAVFFAHDGPRFLRNPGITLLFAAADHLAWIHIRETRPAARRKG